MAKSKRIAYAEYDGNYRKPLNDLLQQSRPGKSVANRDRLRSELQAGYEMVYGVYVPGKKMWVVWCDRLALAVRLLYWDFQAWKDGTADPGEERQKKIERLAELEKAAEEQNERIEKLAEEMEDELQGKYHQYRQAIEKYNNMVYELKTLQAEIENPRQPLLGWLAHLQSRVEACDECLSALVETFQIPPMCDLRETVKEMEESVASMLALPEQMPGIKAEEAYRRFATAVQNLQARLNRLPMEMLPASLEVTISPAPGESSSRSADRPAETSPSDGEVATAIAEDPAGLAPKVQAVPANIPSDLAGLAAYLRKSGDAAAKAAAGETAEALYRQLQADGATPAERLLLNALRVEITLAGWVAALEVGAPNAAPGTGDAPALISEIQALEEKIASNQEKADNPNYSETNRKNFQRAVDKFRKNLEKKQAELAALQPASGIPDLPEAPLALAAGMLWESGEAMDELPPDGEADEALQAASEALRAVAGLEAPAAARSNGELERLPAYQELLAAAIALNHRLASRRPELAVTLPESAAATLPSADAAGLLETLRALRNQLQKMVSGHVIAYNYLMAGDQPTGPGQLYHQEAEKEWLKVHRENPHDWIACHHLAILYHSRAFDLELQGRSKEAETAWKDALRYWQLLIDFQEPVKSIHQLLRDMERFKEDHNNEIQALQDKIIYDLLLIHQRWYEYYIARQQEAEADRHYALIEKIPRPEAQEIITYLYEKNYGSKVNNLGKRFKAKKDDRTKAGFAQEVTTLSEVIKSLYDKRSSLVPAIRDLIILGAWKLQIGLAQWEVNFHELIHRQEGTVRELERMVHELDRLEPQIEELKQKLQRGNSSYVGLHDDLVEKYNGKVRVIQRMQEQINSERRQMVGTLTDLVDMIPNLRGYLDALIASSDNVAKNIAALELQNAVSAILVLNLNDHHSYRILAEDCKNLQLKIKALRSETPGVVPVLKDSAARVNDIWKWVEFKPEENPYTNTAFLMLDTELPSLEEKNEIQALLQQMKQKKLLLDKRARAGKHVVLGRKVSREDLNQVLLRLDSPTELAKDIMLQHQAHRMETADVKAQLGKIELPAPEQVQLELSPGVFAFFKIPQLPGEVLHDWKKPEDAPPEERPRPQIKWPS